MTPVRGLYCAGCWRALTGGLCPECGEHPAVCGCNTTRVETSPAVYVRSLCGCGVSDGIVDLDAPHTCGRESWEGFVP